MNGLANNENLLSMTTDLNIINACVTAAGYITGAAVVWILLDVLITWLNSCSQVAVVVRSSEASHVSRRYRSRTMMNGLMIVAALSTCVSAGASTLTDFNLVVGGNLTSSSEVEGRTLVGGNLTTNASNYAIRLTPSSAYSNVDTLIVGGNIVGGNVNIQAGDVRVGGTTSGNINLNGSGSQLFKSDSSVAGIVSSSLSAMNSLSAYFASLATNSTVVNPAGPSAVKFQATVDNLYDAAVFDVDGSVFSDSNSQQYELINGFGVDSLTTYVFNVSGSNINFNQGNFVSLFTSADVRSRLIWNFTDAESIHVDRNFFGAILAPNADLSISTAVDGSVFVGGNFTQRGEVHLPLYAGLTDPDPSAVPEPSTIALVGAGLVLLGVRYRKNLRVGV